ncbi:LuxR C-terminal-related transcriptional regulator [Leifsonia sp. NPDC056824]|uniref:helix-turn-helix transcriptional regulator n=1 Tax=Leifsonia sp. NPDC056824 TaxID=3345953 RepID=UPI0036D05E98
MIDPRAADSAPLAGRDRVLTLVRELLFSSDADVDLVGPRLSGRSTVVDAVASSAADARRTVVRVNGVRSLRESPLAALHAAGLGVLTSPERRTASALQQAIDALTTAIGSGTAALLVDDADLLDDASTGAIDAVRRATRTPLLRTRARRDEGPSTAYVVELVPLDYEELRSVVAERLGGPVDAGAMSRVYALCGGNVGLALALAELAVLEGRLARASGAWSATGELWSRALRGALEAQISGLSPAERGALERIAVTGVGDVASTRGLVDPAALDGLAAAGVLRIVPHCGRRLLALDPPVLADHLRDRAQVDAPTTDAAFVQLVHAAADARRAEASRAWHAAPSPGSALVLARALMADTGMTPGSAAELDRVLAASAVLPGDPLDAAELAVLRARRSLAAGAELAAALAALRTEVAGLGAFARLADAAAVLLAVEIGAEPAVPEELLRDDSDLPPPVRSRLMEASRAVALRCGRFEDAVRHLDELAALPGAAPASEAAAHAYALLGVGRHAEAVAWAERGAASARDRLDAGAVRAHSVALGLCHLLADRPADAADALATASALGTPAVPGAAVQVALHVLSAVIAVRRGDTTLAERVRDELAAGLPTASDGSPPSAVGAGVRWIDAQLAAGRGRPDEAAELLRRLASTLATHGELPTAALALLTSLEHALDDAGLAEARALLARQQSELHDAHLAFVQARAEPDVADLGALAERLASSGRAGPAAALRHPTGDDGGGGFFSTPIALTDREREITRLVAAGLSNPEIASRLVLSVRTVESHVSRVMRKTSAANRGELVAVALRLTP